MQAIGRHLLSFILPVLVVILVPHWLLTAFASSDSRWNDSILIGWIFRMIGIVIMLIGLGLFGWSVSLFARIGRGTLAPWDPTRNLVAGGPYRYVRNPMISGVVLMLSGEALNWGSWILSLWACVFLLFNHVYFVFSEEPGLERRFGENYRFYKSNVPRWLPRFKPWSVK